MSISSLAVLPADPRDQEVRLLVDLVRLSRLTLLYAEAGADKSSVLRSMVLPLLQDAVGAQTEVAVLFGSWREPPLAALLGQMEHVVGASIPNARNGGPSDPHATFGALLKAWEKNFGITFIIILDRFEEYLAASAESPATREFEEQFVAAVNDRTLHTHFLLSLDEDAAPLLDRLRERIPGLGDARVRLPRLSRGGAPAPSTREGRPEARESAAPDETTVAPAPIFFGSARRSAAFESLDSAEETQPAARMPPSAAAGESLPPDNLASPLVGSRSEPQQPTHTETLAERLERMRAEYNVRSAVETAMTASAAQMARSERKDTPGLAHAAPAPTNTAMPFANDDEVTQQPHDKAPTESRTNEQPRFVPPPTTAAEYKRFPISRGAWLVVAMGILVPSYWVIMRPQNAVRAPENSPTGADSVTPPAGGPADNAAVASNTGGAPTRSDDGRPLRAERDYFASDDWLGQKGTGSAPAHMAQAPTQQAPAPVPPPSRSNPRVQVPPMKRASTAAPARVSSGPLLYIHVRNEAQRARAERMIQPLAKRGIRVTGIKLVHFGPSLPDLRYFRSAERDEAVKVALALREMGIPAQRLHQVSGFEGRATPRQVELWLPAALR
jgi:hypothetical protein